MTLVITTPSCIRWRIERAAFWTYYGLMRAIETILGGA